MEPEGHRGASRHAALHPLPGRTGRLHARRFPQSPNGGIPERGHANASAGHAGRSARLFVAYDSRSMCVCDHPINLRGQLGIDFLKLVPTVWDDTRVLSGVVGEHLVIARRSGRDWYLGALNNGVTRVRSVKLDFLGAGNGGCAGGTTRPTAPRMPNTSRSKKASCRPTPRLTCAWPPAAAPSRDLCDT